jgi:uncharacterized protein
MKTIVRSMLALAVVTMAGLASHGAKAASFDCESKTLAPDEAAICANRDLNDLDVRMATEFKWLSGMYAMGVRGELQDQQTAWLKTRQACQSDTACIRKAYEERLKAFEDDYNKFERPAPSN